MNYDIIMFLTLKLEMRNNGSNESNETDKSNTSGGTINLAPPLDLTPGPIAIVPPPLNPNSNYNIEFFDFLESENQNTPVALENNFETINTNSNNNNNNQNDIFYNSGNDFNTVDDNNINNNINILSESNGISEPNKKLLTNEKKSINFDFINSHSSNDARNENEMDVLKMAFTHLSQEVSSFVEQSKVNNEDIKNKLSIFVQQSKQNNEEVNEKLMKNNEEVNEKLMKNNEKTNGYFNMLIIAFILTFLLIILKK
jgi:hypothetical protein